MVVFIVTRWRYESRAKLMLSSIPIDNSAIRCHKQAPCNGDSVMVVEVVATQEVLEAAAATLASISVCRAS